MNKIEGPKNDNFQRWLQIIYWKYKVGLSNFLINLRIKLSIFSNYQYWTESLKRLQREFENAESLSILIRKNIFLFING